MFPGNISKELQAFSPLSCDSKCNSRCYHQNETDRKHPALSMYFYHYDYSGKDSGWGNKEEPRLCIEIMDTTHPKESDTRARRCNNVLHVRTISNQYQGTRSLGTCVSQATWNNWEIRRRV